MCKKKDIEMSGYVYISESNQKIKMNASNPQADKYVIEMILVKIRNEYIKGNFKSNCIIAIEKRIIDNITDNVGIYILFRCVCTIGFSTIKELDNAMKI
jgi:hypothetical protein